MSGGAAPRRLLPGGGPTAAGAPRGTAAVAGAGGEAVAEATLSVGMAVALGALAMTFAAIFFAYAVVRAGAPAWPPPGEPAPPGPWPWPAAATIAALAASAAAHRARRDGRYLAGAAAAGATFLAIQIGGWLRLAGEGIHPGAGIAASVVFALTIFHAAHALAALVATAAALARAAGSKAARPPASRALVSFWHFVTAAWLTVFTTVFLL